MDGSREHEPTKNQGAKPRWFKHVKDWLSVSEPSAQAMKDQTNSTYKKYGIDKHDPQAAAKMHLPVGKVPDGVTTSMKGPSPEKALRERTREAMARQSYWGRGGSQSVSSGVSSDASTKEAKQIAPWA
ncbi:Uncharacterized protein TPAR_00915 [Tolypocladium paradoxum]|uniref:Uncharacterized protein n=1 Tax=Tolypocladium paradoxum TaxID=94208 RepID=A0A2S4L8X0_9HYPO|nr:Uncharacterized protein TPAR_00915 [Tolypocladium paradoxum]